MEFNDFWLSIFTPTQKQQQQKNPIKTEETLEKENKQTNKQKGEEEEIN